MTQLVTAPVTVPTDFVSLHTAWPGSGSQPVADVGNIRLLDGGAGWRWYDIETSAGVYSWADLDAKITAYRQLGWTVSMPIYGTPTFYASVVDQGFLDKYNKYGGAAYPALDTNLAGLTAFITLLVMRYNSPAGAWRIANPTLGKGLTEIECWNEPRFTQNHTEYWWGSAGQLVDLCHAIKSAALAVDADLTVTSPGFFGADYVQQFLYATGTVNTSVRGIDTCNALNFHAYLGMPWGYHYAGWPYQIGGGVYGLYPIKRMADDLAPGMPIYMSEFGFDTAIAAPSLLSFLGETAELRYTVLARNMLELAARGCKRFGCYSTSTNLTGDLYNDTDGVLRAISLVNGIAGKTIVSADMQFRGGISLELSDGTRLSV